MLPPVSNERLSSRHCGVQLNPSRARCSLYVLYWCNDVSARVCEHGHNVLVQFIETMRFILFFTCWVYTAHSKTIRLRKLNIIAKNLLRYFENNNKYSINISVLHSFSFQIQGRIIIWSHNKITLLNMFVTLTVKSRFSQDSHCMSYHHALNQKINLTTAHILNYV